MSPPAPDRRRKRWKASRYDWAVMIGLALVASQIVQKFADGSPADPQIVTAGSLLMAGGIGLRWERSP